MKKANTKAARLPVKVRAKAKKPVARRPVVAPAAGFPIVGVGASAGGLAAFEAFFSALPKAPGMAFVLVQHLDPAHKSILAEIIGRYTAMPVLEVKDGVAVRPDCVYIIPPGRDMAYLNGALHLLEPASARGHRMPIDFFFRSLAANLHERAIAVVLSGTGSDGTLGVRAVKGEGGMAMAQSPGSAEYDGMPRSALATGLVDYDLPPAKMGAQLRAYAHHAFGRPSRPAAVAPPLAENALKKIFILLRAQTGHDFSLYKPSTIHRRIERRMAVHQVESLDGYVKLLQRTPAEVTALFNDMLIGVTNFFRDPEAFKALEERAISKLFAGKRADAAVRVWCSGCSTGEEAYSLAILLAERMEALKQSFTVQIFATDIDSRAINAARAGLYSAAISADVSPERLARFFTAMPDGGYRVHKSIRDMMIFSEHSLIKDPPFSKLDLLVCRNLMIYLGTELQRRIIPQFHYALNPGGFLFLGTSEGVGEFDALFSSSDRKSKLYQRKADARGPQRAALGRFLPPATALEEALPESASKTTAFPAKLPLRELTEQALLSQVVAAAALVNEKGDILYLHGRTGLFLEPAAGEAGISNILKMAREGLHDELALTLRKAAGTKDAVQSPGLRVKTNGHFTMVDLAVRPVTAGAGATIESPLYLVILREAAPSAATPPAAPQRAGKGDSARIEALRKELRAKEEYLQSAREELESSSEELKSANEEMQSVNEELQSTNEELETSKEELQSVNEELATVNAELQTKVDDLTQTNNDMINLVAGTGIGTVYVDHQLRLLRFTSAARAIINLIPGDVGRPVAHIVSNLVGYDRLVADTAAVLSTLEPKAAEVRTLDGKCYAMRIQPYRTLANVIEGAVITFSDITEMVRIREDLRKANDLLRMAVVVRDAHDAITVQDLEGRTLAWNPGATRLYGWSEAEALKLNVRDRIPADQRKRALDRLIQLSRAKILEAYPTQRLTKRGAAIKVIIISTALLDEAGKVYAIATTERVQEADEK